MNLSIGREEAQLIVALEGKLDACGRRELRRIVAEQFARGATACEIDLARAGYVDSATLGFFVSLANDVAGRGGEFRIVNVSDDLKSLFSLTRLGMLFGSNGSQSSHAARTSQHPANGATVR